MVRNFHFSRKSAVPSTPSVTLNQSQQNRAESAAVGGRSRGLVVLEKRDVFTSFFEAGAKLPESSSPGGDQFANPMLAIAAAMLDAEYYMRNRDGSCRHSVRLMGYAK